MQDRAIAAIGEWQLQKNKDLEEVDLYIENMFPEKDYQMLLLVFEIDNTDGILNCEYKGIDIERVSSDNEDYRKYAYRKGTSGRAGDVTITTKLTLNKLKNIKDFQFKKLISSKRFVQESVLFNEVYKNYVDDYLRIESEIKNILKELPKKGKEAIGISIRIEINGKDNYLHDFDIVNNVIENEYFLSKVAQNNVKSQAKSKTCSITGKKEEDIYGFAGSFKYSTFDKPGFISGYFNKELNWKNYPISKKEALNIELGRRYIRENLNSTFYGHEYIIVPNPIIRIDKDKLTSVLQLIRNGLIIETVSKETKKRSEERVLKLIANEKNYFNVDMLFFEENKTNKSMKINLMLEEILPSRFRQLFIDVPEEINKRIIFKNAIYTKKGGNQDLKFSFQIIKNFFKEHFLEIVNKLFLGKPISTDYVFENIISLIRKNYNKSKTQDGYVEYTEWTVKKAIMLLSYLQRLNITDYNKNFKYMETESTEKKESRFNIESFNDFVKENTNFLDSDIKVGIFAVGVLVRFLFDIQSHSLNNTPFENKLRGYKLNPELLMNVYTEALDKIQKYQKNFYVYTDLRDIINRYFILKSNDLTKMSNNELSFYFVAGLELGKQFKRDKTGNNKN